MSPSTLEYRYGVPVLVCAADGPALRDDRDLVDLIGEAYERRAELVLVPVTRLPPEFFSLRSGLAGQMAQKFVNYRFRLAILGDVSGHVAGSQALRDFERKSNRGRQLWFVATDDELNQRLAAAVWSA